MDEDVPLESGRPASSTSTRVDGSALSRFASAQPGGAAADDQDVERRSPRGLSWLTDGPRSAPGELSDARLGVVDVVEGEDVEAGDLRLRVGQRGAEPVDQPIRAEAAGCRKRDTKEPFLRRKRSESPIPMRVETRNSFARWTAPGMPT